MKNLFKTVIDIASNSPPEKVTQLAKLIKKVGNPNGADILLDWAANSGAKSRVKKLMSLWVENDMPANELAAMLEGASAAYHHARGEQEIELVWTGPSSSLVATRKTEQALLQVINNSKSRLFITSFVAYNVPSVMKALEGAATRGVEISMLLEASEAHGGGVTIDALGKMKKALPTANMLSWVNKEEGFSGGKVHAKVAVADETHCFISSANLTGHAMEKNMEAGISIKGGSVPRNLHRHLEALETTHVIVRI